MSDTPRTCPHCNGSLARYEDPKAVEIIASLESALGEANRELNEAKAQLNKQRDELLHINKILTDGLRLEREQRDQWREVAYKLHDAFQNDAGEGEDYECMERLRMAQAAFEALEKEKKP